MEPGEARLICGHIDSGKFGKYLNGLSKPEPMAHCGPERTKFEQHPMRNPNGSLKVSTT
jgi:hypothetical protein